MGVAVHLEWPEVYRAAEVGIMRQVSACQKKRADCYGLNPADGWSAHIEGACGELAVAKYFDRFWSGTIGQVDQSDVGEYEVRTSDRQNARLILHPNDKDGARFFLVTGHAPDFELVGWIYARDGKRPEFWTDPTGKNRPAFFIPQSALHPIKRKDT